ncbi:MAG: hypothetical protein ACR2QW_11395 [bacterium]
MLEEIAKKNKSKFHFVLAPQNKEFIKLGMAMDKYLNIIGFVRILVHSFVDMSSKISPQGFEDCCHIYDLIHTNYRGLLEVTDVLIEVLRNNRLPVNEAPASTMNGAS